MNEAQIYNNVLRTQEAILTLNRTLKTDKEDDYLFADDIIADKACSGANSLQLLCHGLAAHSGWWGSNGKADPRENPMCFSQKLCLIHSEVSEAMEGDRKSLKDDHLPHRDMREVELADAIIRIFDLAGAYGLDLSGAIIEKLAYNQRRADHKVENRDKEGGKAY